MHHYDITSSAGHLQFLSSILVLFTRPRATNDLAVLVLLRVKGDRYDKAVTGERTPGRRRVAGGHDNAGQEAAAVTAKRERLSVCRMVHQSTDGSC